MLRPPPFRPPEYFQSDPPIVSLFCFATPVISAGHPANDLPRLLDGKGSALFGRAHLGPHRREFSLEAGRQGGCRNAAAVTDYLEVGVCDAGVFADVEAFELFFRRYP
jgi:hypothetical protein